MTPDRHSEKILRIGIIEGGRIIEERLLRPREPVTLGQSQRNKFTILSPGLPSSVTLIDYRSGKYLLVFEKGAIGKVQVGEEVLDLKTVAQRGLADRKDHRFSLPLTEQSRGKIVVNDVTVLFQFVTPPPSMPRGQKISTQVGSAWDNLDGAFLMSFFFSLLVMVGTFGYLQFWWQNTGKYLKPGIKAEAKMLATLLALEKPKEEKKPEKKEEDKTPKRNQAPPDQATAQADADRIMTMAQSQALADADGLAQEGALPGDVETVNTGAIGSIDIGMPAPMAFGGGSARPMPGSGTKVAVVGSMFGEGEGTVAEGLARGRRRAAGLLAGPTTMGGGGYGMGGGGNSISGGFGGPGAFAVPSGALAAAPATFTLPSDVGKVDTQSAEIQTGKTEIVVVQTNNTNVEREPTVKFSTSGGGASEKPEVAEVRKKIRSRSSGIQRCYKTEVRKNRQLAGKIKVRVQVDNEGLATVTVVDDQMAGSSVSGCIVQVIKQIVFNKARADIYQTFMFSSE